MTSRDSRTGPRWYRIALVLTLYVALGGIYLFTTPCLRLRRVYPHEYVRFVARIAACPCLSPSSTSARSPSGSPASTGSSWGLMRALGASACPPAAITWLRRPLRGGLCRPAPDHGLGLATAYVGMLGSMTSPPRRSSPHGILRGPRARRLGRILSGGCGRGITRAERATVSVVTHPGGRRLAHRPRLASIGVSRLPRSRWGCRQHHRRAAVPGSSCAQPQPQAAALVHLQTRRRAYAVGSKWRS